MLTHHNRRKGIHRRKESKRRHKKQRDTHSHTQKSHENTKVKAIMCTKRISTVKKKEKYINKTKNNKGTTDGKADGLKEDFHLSFSSSKT